MLHEFRALTLFAMRNYKEAAATLYAVLSVGPGWDWTTMIDLYPSEQVYESQLRALEAYVGQNPDAPDGHFVLAYQYMTAAHPEEAAQQYQDVLHLVPTDSVSRQMLALLNSTDDQPGAAPPATAPPANAGGPAVSRAANSRTVDGAQPRRRERRLVVGQRRPFRLEVRTGRQRADLRRQIRTGGQHARSRLRQRRHDGGESRLVRTGTLHVPNGRRPAERSGTLLREDAVMHLGRLEQAGENVLFLGQR